MRPDPLRIDFDADSSQSLSPFKFHCLGGMEVLIVWARLLGCGIPESRESLWSTRCSSFVICSASPLSGLDGLWCVLLFISLGSRDPRRGLSGGDNETWALTLIVSLRLYANDKNGIYWSARLGRLSSLTFYLVNISCLSFHQSPRSPLS